MDRDTVRLLLIIAGVILLAGIYLWGRLKQPLLQYLDDDHNADSPGHAGGDAEPEALRDDLPHAGGGQRKEPHLSSLDFAGTDDELDSITENAVMPPEQHAQTESSPDGKGGAPFLIQVSLVAGPGRFFHGPDLKQALLDADLLFGDMGIFHRYNRELTQTLFSVASLVEPGTFPIDDMGNFECPGIVLFFQTARVSDPLGTYDDLVNTSRELAHSLHGIQWDENRQPLSASKIALMRNLLKQHAIEPGS